MKICNIILIITLLSGIYTVTEAAPVITTKAVNDSVFDIYVSNLTEISTINFVVSYDAAGLEKPVVTDGALATAYKGALVGINTTVDGVVSGAYLFVGCMTNPASCSGMKSGGVLARITFNKKKAASNGITEIKTDVYSPTGELIGSESHVNLDVKSDTSTTSEAPKSSYTGGGTGGSSGSNGTTTPVATGVSTGVTITDPSITSAAQQQKPEEPKSDAGHQPAPQQPVSVEQPVAGQQNDTVSQVGGTASTPAKPVAAVLAELKGFDSVTDRFKDYKGARTLKAMAALLEQPEQRTRLIVQKPAVITADGKSLMTLRFQLNAAVTPSFSFKGANLKAIRSYSGGVWELDAVPQKGKTDVRVSIMSQGDSAEIPLTVIPPFEPKQEKELSEQTDAQIEALLAKPLATKTGKPAYDLNADGKQDYLDDYILLAHWYMKRLKADKDKKAVIPPKKP